MSERLLVALFRTQDQTDHAYAYLKVFDLSQQHLTVGPHTTLSYWIYPQSQAQNSGVGGENSTQQYAWSEVESRR